MRYRDPFVFFGPWQQFKLNLKLQWIFLKCRFKIAYALAKLPNKKGN